MNEAPDQPTPHADPAEPRLPLEGIRVLDLSHVIAGPLATHQLRMMGAEVIKIERPEGGDGVRAVEARPEWGGRPPEFRALNPGKLSVTLDLKSDTGRAQVLELARSAQVFVENFRPGVAARLGLGPAEIRKVRPDVVYCSISGWGQSGTLSKLPAYDHVIQAASGMMTMQGFDGAPVKVGFPVVDMATGMSAATAIVAALLRRARGDTSNIEIDVSMIDNATLLMSTAVAQTRSSGVPPRRAGNRGFVGSPGSDTFAAADGYISIAANTMGQFRRMCAIIDRPDLAAAPYLPDGLPETAFLTNLASEELGEALRAAILAWPSREFEAALAAAGVPAARVRNVKEFLDEVYPLCPGMDVPGEPLAVGTGFRDKPQPTVGAMTVPTLGGDTRTVLSSLSEQPSALGF